MIVCIVGTRSPVDEDKAEKAIHKILSRYNVGRDIIISGGATGIDSIAEKLAKERGFRFVVFKPRTNTWESYRERNWSMAYACDILYRVRDYDRPSRGSGWTMKAAQKLGKITYEVVMD